MNQASPDLATMMQSLRTAQQQQPMPDWTTRATRLRALERLLSDHHDAITSAIEADFGCRPAQETALLEIFPSRSAIRHALRHGKRWIQSRQRLADWIFLPARTELIPQPRGVVGIIVPWNYPLYLAVGPLVDALTAGNRVMVKMSEYTPRFSSLFADLVHSAFRSDEIMVVTGAIEVARAFAALPFDHLLFTGSTATGRAVMRAAAENLTPVTLELGGKSPVIIGPEARLDHAVERIMLGKLVNAGQTCIAPDYVLLPRARVDAFITTARAVVSRYYPGLKHNQQYASIATDHHFRRLCALRDGAKAAGARLEALSDVAPDPRRRLLPPILIAQVHNDMALMQEEIFGPLLPLLPYDSVDEALAFVTSRPAPLALYLFEQNRARINQILGQTCAGGVSVNDTLYHIAQHHLPFGGVGASGIGGYHGETGFRTFSHMKPVFHQARINGAGLLKPPYGKRFSRLLRWLLKYG